MASGQNSGILGYQCVLNRPGGCCSIIALVFERSKGLVAFFFSLGLGVAVAVMLTVGQVLVLGSDVSFSI